MSAALRSARLVAVLLLALTPAIARAADGWAGGWNGILDANGKKLRLVFHVTRRQDGGLAGTFDTPDQGAMGLALDSLRTDADTLDAVLLQGKARYHGVIDRATGVVHGTWSQSGIALPLDLGHDAPAEHRRPQDPTPPFPYTAIEASVANPRARLDLACTLTSPPGKGPFPAVLLITGSGPQDRDESIMGHHPFLVLADRLTRHGFVVLRCDDRGTARSGGRFEGATTRDFVDDARAELTWLRRRPNVDPRRVGLVGHSEGGLIAPWIAASDPAVAFVVMLAGPGVPGDSIIVSQRTTISRAAGVSDSVIADQVGFLRAMLREVRTGRDSTALAKALRPRVMEHMRAQPGVTPGLMDSLTTIQLRSLLSPWLRAFVAHDPRPDLQRVRCPVLAMNGSRDTQVLSSVNLPAIASALRKAGNRDAHVVEMPGLNHLFQTATTGGMAEYGAIEETIAPAALDTLTGWLDAHVAPRRARVASAAR